MNSRIGKVLFEHVTFGVTQRRRRNHCARLTCVPLPLRYCVPRDEPVLAA